MFGEDEVKSWFSNYELKDYLDDEQIAVINSRGTWSKERLATDIIDYYLMREIGFETPGYFKIRAQNKMRLIMEKYLPLIYTTAIKYDPLVNEDYTETYFEDRSHTDRNNVTRESTTSDTETVNNSQTATTTGSNSNTSTGTSLVVNSDTPQGQINKAEILAGNYASSTQANESTTTSSGRDESTTTGSSDGKTTRSGNDNATETGNNSGEGKTSYTKSSKGNRGVTATSQGLIRQYRENILTINQSIIDELSTLFIGLY